MSIDVLHLRGHSSTGYQALTVSTVAVAPTIPANTARCLIVVEAQPVRWRDDGTAPTATVGTLLTAGQAVFYDGEPTRLQLIRQGATDATVHFSYYS
jgi:hypothetical protein